MTCWEDEEYVIYYISLNHDPSPPHGIKLPWKMMLYIKCLKLMSNIYILKCWEHYSIKFGNLVVRFIHWNIVFKHFQRFLNKILCKYFSNKMKFYVFLFKSDFKKDTSRVLVMYLWENAPGNTIITNACDKIAFLKILHIFINVYYRFSIYMYVYIKICMYIYYTYKHTCLSRYICVKNIFWRWVFKKKN